MKTTKIGHAVRIGKYHTENNMRCQDRAYSGTHIVERNDKYEKVILLAVADGISSCAYSDIGAQFVIDEIKNNIGRIYNIFCEHGADLWDPSTRDSDIRTVRRSLIARAKEHAIAMGVDKHDMETTLSFAIIGPETTFLFCIGDSPIFIRCEGETHVREYKDKHSSNPSATGTNSSLSLQGWMDRTFARYNTHETTYKKSVNGNIECFQSPGIESIIVCTDGADPFCTMDKMDAMEKRVRCEDTSEQIDLEEIIIADDDVGIAYFFKGDE
jgi:serine/threonine protein phosphatase PrpC